MDVTRPSGKGARTHGLEHSPRSPRVEVARARIERKVGDPVPANRCSHDDKSAAAQQRESSQRLCDMGV